MFDQNMRTEAIPERVFMLCKTVEKKPLSIPEARSRMEPDYLQNKTVYFTVYRNAAQELGLISVSDNVISLCVDPTVVESLESMRLYINANIENLRNSQFYKVTNEYFRRGDSILTEKTNIVNLATSFTSSLHIQVDGDDMRAWRFWAPFLGMGYMQDMLMIPNAAVFLNDAIQNAGINKGMYSFGEFVQMIRSYCGILFGDELIVKTMNFGVSNGLRTLHDMGIIRMEHIMDQQDIWSLYAVPFHSISETVTNVTIL